MLRQRDHYELVLYGATLRKTDYGDTLLCPKLISALAGPHGRRRRVEWSDRFPHDEDFDEQLGCQRFPTPRRNGCDALKRSPAQSPRRLRCPA